MKTFEERYTAWIDGKLEGPALTAFELELSRRAAAGEARADKADATRLRALLKAGLQAPAMTNTEFFSHQLSERIAVDRAADRRRELPRGERRSLFSWTFGQLAGAGAAALFCAAALFYGLMPGSPGAYGGKSAQSSAPAKPGTVVASNDSSASGSPVPARVPTPTKPGEATQYAQLTTPTPTPLDTAAPDIQKVEVADQSKPTTTATPLHYVKPDVNVIWINGLDYLPNVPDENAPGPALAGTPVPAPAPTAGTQP